MTADPSESLRDPKIKSAGARATLTGARPGAEPERSRSTDAGSPLAELFSAHVNSTPKTPPAVASGNGVAKPVMTQAERALEIERRRKAAATLAEQAAAGHTAAKG